MVDCEKISGRNPGISFWKVFNVIPVEIPGLVLQIRINDWRSNAKLKFVDGTLLEQGLIQISSDNFRKKNHHNHITDKSFAI